MLTQVVRNVAKFCKSVLHQSIERRASYENIYSYSFALFSFPLEKDKKKRKQTVPYTLSWQDVTDKDPNATCYNTD